ncbi:MAG TPA: hypothetical protein VGN08_08520 [Solirubrobacteraceae bacterium]
MGSRSAARGAKLGMRAIAAGVKAGSALADLQRQSRPAVAPHTGSAAGGFLSGITTMYFLDPTAGKQRRRMAGQKARKLFARAPAEQRPNEWDASGPAAGTVHDIRAERTQPPRSEEEHGAAAAEPQAGSTASRSGDAGFAP